jgi:hypothetical protein
MPLPSPRRRAPAAGDVALAAVMLIGERGDLCTAAVPAPELVLTATHRVIGRTSAR